MTRRADEIFVKVVQRHMRGFLRSGVTGCDFAAAHATASGGPLLYNVRVGPLDQELPGEIELFLDGAGEENAAAMLVFPELRAATDVCELVSLLHAEERWTISRAAWKKHEREELPISMYWRTASGDITSVMGLAPLGSMPATRRAPYVALVAWTGGRKNEFRTRHTKGEVGLVDMCLPEGMTEETYRAAFKNTLRTTKRLKSALAEGAAEPHIAFCLPAECESLLPIG